jgi:hypothetical protein
MELPAGVEIAAPEAVTLERVRALLAEPVSQPILSGCHCRPRVMIRSSSRS